MNPISMEYRDVATLGPLAEAKSVGAKPLDHRDFGHCSFQIFECSDNHNRKSYVAIIWARPTNVEFTVDELSADFKILGEVQARDLEKLYAGLPEIAEQFRKELGTE